MTQNVEDMSDDELRALVTKYAEQKAKQFARNKEKRTNGTAKPNGTAKLAVLLPNYGRASGVWHLVPADIEHLRLNGIRRRR
jgi:hypothetical protein